MRLFNIIKICSLGIIASAAVVTAENADAQPIKLLKDLRPGMVVSDSRKVLQLTETTDTLYYLTESLEDPTGSGSGEVYLNSTNGDLQDLDLGYSLGQTREFGHGRYAPWHYPFYAIVDGKAVFHRQVDGVRSAFYQLDGATGELEKLTAWEDFAFVSAVWPGSDGNVCYLKFRAGSPNLEIGRFQPSSQNSEEIVTTVPLANVFTGYEGDARVVGNRLVFTLVENDGANMRVIGSDGSATGTEVLLNLSSSQYLDASLVSALDRCFIAVVDSGTGKRLLYVTDGTLTGTHLVDSHLAEPFLPHNSSATAESTSTLYWISQGGSNVYFSDGITTGVLPKEEWPQSTYESIVQVGGKLYISARDFYNHNSAYVLVSDGQSTPTQLGSWESPMSQIWADCKTSTGSLVYTDSGIYFVKDSFTNAVLMAEGRPEYRPEIPTVCQFKGEAVFNRWMENRTDQLFHTRPGDTVAPSQLTAFTQTPDSSDPSNFEAAAALLFFHQIVRSIGGWSTDFYRTDGTAAGTKELLPADPVFLGPTAGGMVFYYRDHIDGDGYWGDGKVMLTDGSGGIPVELADASMSYPEKPPTRLFNLEDRCYIGGIGGMGEARLIETDGTVTGTHDISLGTDSSLQYPLKPIGTAGSIGLFYGPDSTAAGVFQIWATDGTEDGTTKIADLPYEPTPGASLTTGLVAFGAKDETGAWWLYTSDGTASGTIKLKTESSWTSLHHFTASGSQVFFVAGSPYRKYADLYVTDGTRTDGPRSLSWLLDEDEHTQVVPNNGNGVIMAGRTSYGSAIVFYTRSLISELVHDGPSTDVPLILYGDGFNVYHTKTTDQHGREVWRSNRFGSHELVQDLAPGRASGAVMKQAVVFANKLFFSADPHDGLTGREPHYIELPPGSSVREWELY